jgi:hypothetical protein
VHDLRITAPMDRIGNTDGVNIDSCRRVVVEVRKTPFFGAIFILSTLIILPINTGSGQTYSRELKKREACSCRMFTSTTQMTASV